MQRLIVLLFFVSTAVLASAQSPMVDKLIDEGVVLFDLGKYDEAIKKYERALDLNPKSMAARYELAYTYYTKGDYYKALENSRIVSQAESEYWIDGMVIYGASYESLGKSSRAIKVFEKALAKRPDHTKLRFNAALSYFSTKQYEKAEQYTTIVIEQDKANTSAHLLLANIELMRGDKLGSMMAFYYFLLLEQNGDRSLKAYEMLTAIWDSLAKSGKSQNDGKVITLQSTSKNIEFQLAALAAKVETTTEPHLHAARTKLFTSAIASYATPPEGFWKNIYYDFYSQLETKGFALPFAYFTAQCKYNAQSAEWLAQNYALFGSFTSWMSAQ
jgi:tetratricopeptide (TPR) repeat protein